MRTSVIIETLREKRKRKGKRIVPLSEAETTGNDEIDRSRSFETGRYLFWTNVAAV
jgi:hypothetical protein